MEVFYFQFSMPAPDFHRRPDFIHHQPMPRVSLIREVIFGIEDGMVSTMGALTGIAVGSSNRFVVILSGLVLVAVEAVSMAVGSYLSSKSERAIDERKLHEERLELKQYPREEEKELVAMYVKDGWPEPLAVEMANAASKNKDLFLQEMAYRELKIIPEHNQAALPLQNGVAMGIAYIIGGAFPLLPYFFTLAVTAVIPYSIGATLVGLFAMGAYTTKYSRRQWWKAGLEMLALASAAAVIGYLVGRLAEQWLR